MGGKCTLRPMPLAPSGGGTSYATATHNCSHMAVQYFHINCPECDYKLFLQVSLYSQRGEKQDRFHSNETVDVLNLLSVVPVLIIIKFAFMKMEGI